MSTRRRLPTSAWLRLVLPNVAALVVGVVLFAAWGWFVFGSERREPERCRRAYARAESVVDSAAVDEMRLAGTGGWRVCGELRRAGHLPGATAVADPGHGPPSITER